MRPYHEVAVILAGDADVVADDGTVHTLGPGDVLVTPKGSAGTWRIRETIVKSFTIASRWTERTPTSDPYGSLDPLRRDEDAGGAVSEVGGAHGGASVASASAAPGAAPARSSTAGSP